MDSSILKHSNVLETYGIKLELDPQKEADNIRSLVPRISAIIKILDIKAQRMIEPLEAKRRNKIANNPDIGDDAKKKLTADEDSAISQINQRINGVKTEYAEVKATQDLYRYIHFFIKYSCDIYISDLRREERDFVAQEVELAPSTDELAQISDIEEPNDVTSAQLEAEFEDKAQLSFRPETITEKRIRMLRYVANQLAKVEDVKKYLELLQVMESLDVEHMDCGDILAGKGNLAQKYKYAVKMYDAPYQLLDVETDVGRVIAYSLGAYTYSEDSIQGMNPYEIIGVVRKNAKGEMSAYSAIIPLRQCREVECTNFEITGDDSKMEFNVTNRVSSQPPGLKVKYSSPAIPKDMIRFFVNIVFSEFVLEKAQSNFGYIGDIENGSGAPKYNGYRLTLNLDESESILESLSVAMSMPGKMTGFNTNFYGNNLQAVLISVKNAVLAKCEIMEQEHKLKDEKTSGRTQGDE